MLRFLVLAALALGPPVAAADERIERLPERLRAWLEDEVVYIISAREKEFFLELEAMEERDAFVAAFWRRRDPDPLTEINEFREEHSRRIDYANRRLGGEAAIPGWKTDRGRMYIILGEPRDRSNFRNVGGIYPAEVWFYDGDRMAGLPPLYLLFFQPGGAGALRLYNHFIDRPERLILSMGLLAEDLAEAYTRLQEISPELANAAMSMRADQGGYSFSTGLEAGALDSSQVLANIHESPYRRLDTSYIDAARSARGMVEAEYMFNYMSSSVAVDVLPGPAGESLVHFSIEIDPQHLTLMREENRFYTAFELHAEVSSPSEEVVHTLSKVEYLQLGPSELRQVGRPPLCVPEHVPARRGELPAPHRVQESGAERLHDVRRRAAGAGMARGRAVPGESPCCSTTPNRLARRLGPDIGAMSSRAWFFIPMQNASTRLESRCGSTFRSWGRPRMTSSGSGYSPRVTATCRSWSGIHVALGVPHPSRPRDTGTCRHPLVAGIGSESTSSMGRETSRRARTPTST